MAAGLIVILGAGTAMHDAFCTRSAKIFSKDLGGVVGWPDGVMVD